LEELLEALLVVQLEGKLGLVSLEGMSGVESEAL